MRIVRPIAAGSRLNLRPVSICDLPLPAPHLVDRPSTGSAAGPPPRPGPECLEGTRLLTHAPRGRLERRRLALHLKNIGAECTDTPTKMSC